ncbi:holo-[acyl-carrier-protein] synthase [Paenibacillus baekrokdamisoli]|uniref:Holo-[acyl-carrier-protein] synthase n=1 Tax=Paenibacillus baekrokdamisoli TaxID=1712516 RepID=A0A3G9J7U3_9BACL|nr:holo-ACP synthase [Paenibacillus baekrokdamisoli]MBB3071598.1 holo-[acyl-carrier protein] synthase [Paenibacillus baekrokdamisoli]BBH21891.1 holo-[acyl-carrier-protein] synthase [Paenibacillus baekrokdamisoli]
MIIGIGHDLTSLERIQQLLQGQVGSRFISRILTESEQEMANAVSGSRRIEFIAGRFAVKEAVSKAFGCGIGGKLAFRDIEVGRDDLGKPICRLSEDAWGRLNYEKEQIVVHVTITHDKMLASAFVILEQI